MYLCTQMSSFDEIIYTLDRMSINSTPPGTPHVAKYCPSAPKSKSTHRVVRTEEENLDVKRALVFE